MKRGGEALLDAIGDAPIGVIDERFELLREAGFGGMGTVYRARDLTTSKDVAVKIVTTPTKAFAERFEREAAVLAELEHPNIVRYVAHGRTSEGEAYLAMEWLEGESVARRLAREPMDLKTAMRLGRDVADALAVAHDRGVIHRDLKPSNLLLTEEGARVVVVDFGIAKAKDRAIDLTKSGELVGTPGYIAPEQARGARDLDGRADLFSLGCVLYRCVTGERAFGGDDVLSVLAKLVLVDPPRPRTLRPDMPFALDALIHASLAKAPGDRPRDAGAVRDELDRILAEGDGAPATMRAGSPSTPRPTIEDVGCVVLARGAEQLSAEALLDAERRVTELGGVIVPLAGGGVVATVPQSIVASTVPAGAAACAEIIHGLVPDAAVAVVACSDEKSTERRGAASLLDLAGRMLHDAPSGSIRVPPKTAPAFEGLGLPIAVIDDVAVAPTARLAPRTLPSGSGPAGSGAPTRRSGDPEQPERARPPHPVLFVGAIGALLASVMVLRLVAPTKDGAPAASSSAPAAPSPAPDLASMIRFGGPGKERAVAVALEGGASRVAFEIDGSMELGGKTYEARAGKLGVLAAVEADGDVAWSVPLVGDLGVDVRAIAARGDRTAAIGFFHGTLTANDKKVSAAGRDGLFVIEVDAAGAVTRLAGYGGADLDLFLAQASIALLDNGKTAIAGGFGGSLDLGCGVERADDVLDAFVALLGPDGRCEWMHRVGEGGLQAFEWVGVDLSRQVTVAGEMHGVATVGGRRHESSGGIDVFVARYDEKGQARWSRRFGNSSGLQGSVRGALEPLGAVYLAGWFEGAIDFGGGPLESRGEGHDFLVAKLDAAGQHVHSRVLHVERSPCARDRCRLDRIGVTADASGRAVVALPFAGELDWGSGSVTSRGRTDFAAVELDERGEVAWVKAFGDDGASCVIPGCFISVARDGASIVVAGGYEGTLGETAALDEDAFLARLPAARAR